MPEYGEILSDMNSTFRTLNHAASRIDDHVTVMAHASHLLKVAALLYATAKAEGRRAMEAVAEASGPDFQHCAYEFAVKFFREHGKASAEDCTEAMLAAGIRPHDLRSMGHVYKRLVKDNIVTFAGNCARRMGHGAAGGRLYEVVR